MSSDNSLPAAHAPRDHAASMDAIYRTQRHIYDLTRKYYLLGRDRLISDLAPPPGGSVLEVGCGTARNLIVAARLYPSAHFYGFDISDAMLDRARACVARAGLAQRITLAKGDATGFDPMAMFGQPGFDRVFCSYTLSMIPGWRQAISAAADALRDGGRLHLVDFGDQEGLPGWFSRGLHAWLARFHVTPRNDLGAQVACTSHERGLLCDHRMLYRSYAQYAVISR